MKLNSELLKTIGYTLIPILLIAFTLAINNRMLTSSRATSPQLTVSLKTNDCATSQQWMSCSTQAQRETVVPIVVELTSKPATKISGVELYFRFDPKTLSYEGYSETTETFGTEVINEARVYREWKIVHLVLVADKSSANLKQSALIGLNFKAIQNGTGKIEFMSKASSAIGKSGLFELVPQNTATTAQTIAVTVVSTNPTNTPMPQPTATTAPQPTVAPTSNVATPNPTNTPVPTSTPNPTPTASNAATPTPTKAPTPTPVNNVTLLIRSKLAGITAKPLVDYCQQRPFKLTITGGSFAQPIIEYPVFTAEANGIYSAKVRLPPVTTLEKYRLYLKGPLHLQRSFCSLSPGEEQTCVNNKTITFTTGENTVDLTGAPLLPGDLPIDGQLQNGVLDSADVLFLRRSFTKTDISTLLSADLNCDGAINAADNELILRSMQLQYDDEK